MHDSGFVLSLITFLSKTIEVSGFTYFAMDPLHCLKYSREGLLPVLNKNKNPSACFKSWVNTLLPNLRITNKELKEVMRDEA